MQRMCGDTLQQQTPPPKCHRAIILKHWDNLTFTVPLTHLHFTMFIFCCIVDSSFVLCAHSNTVLKYVCAYDCM